MKYPDFTSAACKGIDTEMFYPIESEVVEGSASYIDLKTVKRICSECPIKDVCLEWGVLHERFGVWGGATSSERERIRIERNIFVIEPQYFEFYKYENE